MNPIDVRVGRGYSVSWVKPEDLSGIFEGAIVITDAHVDGVWGRLLPDGVPKLVLPAGEQTKSLEAYRQCLEFLMAIGAKRSSRLVAFGGGVIGDLAGFVAATYMRGVDFIQAPTSLLAMVDASVGGKVGIDLPQGKNLVGAFHQPTDVWIACDLLTTLPERHFRNGMAEVWKMAWALDSTYLTQLRRGLPIEEAMHRSIELKARIVERDERDLIGVRAILNCGHTIAHAIEVASGYSVLHGEAVAIGLVLETRLAETIKVAPDGLADRVKLDLQTAGLPTSLPDLPVGALVDAMWLDKKVVAGGLSFALLQGEGACKLVEGVAESVVRSVLV